METEGHRLPEEMCLMSLLACCPSLSLEGDGGLIPIWTGLPSLAQEKDMSGQQRVMPMAPFMAFEDRPFISSLHLQLSSLIPCQNHSARMWGGKGHEAGTEG